MRTHSLPVDHRQFTGVAQATHRDPPVLSGDSPAGMGENGSSPMTGFSSEDCSAGFRSASRRPGRASRPHYSFFENVTAGKEKTTDRSDSTWLPAKGQASFPKFGFGCRGFVRNATEFDRASRDVVNHVGRQ